MTRRFGVGMALAVLASACSGQAKSPGAAAAAVKPTPAASPELDRNRPLPSPLPDPTAWVNGQPVPLRNVIVFAEQAVRRGAVPAERRPFAYREATQQLIARELLFQEATGRKLAPDAKQMEAAENEARVAFKDDKAWEAFLSREGMDLQTFRTELRIQHTVQALIRQEVQKSPSAIPDAEAKAFYDGNPQLFESGERLRASHILLRVAQGAAAAQKAEARKKAEGILARIRKGEAFGKLAKEFSEDPGSRGREGELDPFARGQMVPPFEQAAYALKPGEVSGIVESPFGFHIIKLHERLPSLKLGLEQAKEQVKQRLLQQRRQEALQTLVNALRAKAKIETYL